MKGADIDSLKKSSKKLQEEVKSLREYINGKTQTKQGYGQVPQVTVMNQYQLANMSISSKPLAPGNTEKDLVKRAAQLIEEAVQKVNEFRDGTWKRYKEQAEKTKMDPFGK
jgi:DNA-binding protein YbaB